MSNTLTTIAGLGMFAIGAIVLVMIFIVAPLVGDTVDTNMDVPGNESASVTITFTDNFSTAGETIVLANETYTFGTGVGAFMVTIGDPPSTSASASVAGLVAEVNTNSTYFKAYNNPGVNTTTITAKDAYTGDDANDWTVSETGANMSASASTFRGGVDSSYWDDEYNTDISKPHDLWGNCASMIELAAMMIVIVGFLTTIKGIKN